MAELIADIEEGVFVNELIGHGVNGVTGDYSRGASGFRIVNGEIAAQGAYPRRDELARLSGLVAAASSTKRKIRLSTAGCCTPGSGCC